MKYRKKPVMVEAFRLGVDPIPLWFDERMNKGEAMLCRTCNDLAGPLADLKLSARILTLEGVMTASEGDYIILGVQGEVYPCKSDIFEQTYERVEE
ncbi:hypothetical protein [Fibrobacter sp.]|uniref:hypothetical protein n=1 Tax=Fibrobacter sp. TaxID=35828 RepID=UPI00388DDA3E